MKIFNSPLRKRFIMGMCIMLLPLIFISVGAFLSLQNVIKAFENTAEETINEQIPIMRIQTLLLKAWMPANDYLVHGDLSERDNYKNLSKEVDESFKKAFSSSYALKAEQDNLKDSYREWLIGKKLGQELVSIKNPVANKAAAKKMELFDKHIDKSVAKLEKIYILTKDEIDDELSEAHGIRDNIILNITVTFAIGLAIAIISALLLARSILKPINLLDEGVNNFGNGQFAHRVNLNTKDELGDLAISFNKMAENIVITQEKLKYLSNHDYLTGLYNRLEFYRRVEEEMKKSKENSTPFTILLMDIDYFKNVNDIYGHHAGDEALSTLAKILTSKTRDIDFVARYGGEEFVIILSGASNQQAFDIAESLRQEIELTKIDIGNGQRVKITVSMGMAVYPYQSDNSRELIAAADNALYMAKNSGRNQIKGHDVLK